MNAGLRTLRLTDDRGEDGELLLLYPTGASAQPELLGERVLDVARDAVPCSGPLPLVIVSHGSRGSHLMHVELAQRLARQGWAVGLPEHPRDNRRDASLFGTKENLVRRPARVTAALDALADVEDLDVALGPAEVSVVGHSMGGCTALVTAGARVPGQAVAADPRVGDLVLMAPAAGWLLAPGALDAVSSRVLVLVAEHDALLERTGTDALVARLTRAEEVVLRQVDGAGHFSFLSPFRSERTSRDLPPSQDPPGFDRSAFQERLAVDVAAFLLRREPRRGADPAASA